jgi:FG-GAP repeat
MNSHIFFKTRLLLVSFFFANAMIAYSVHGQEFNQDHNLIASDGELNERFGRSIAINNGIVAVGAHLDNDNGNRSGSAYLFDASTGAQIAKLLPNDGAVDDEFGYSIAIDNGIVAVGAWRDDHNGLRSGSAYIFDASTGEQLFKLLPIDGVAHDWFGGSIAIDDGIVAVGAVGADSDDDNGNGNGSGSAYLFDASTGKQLFKLLPNDGMAGDNFGNSISIDNGIVVVGAPYDDSNGDDSGSAYLFDVSTGAQLFKLLPSDGATDEYFGNSISIDNGIVAVGRIGDSPSGENSGSAYLFDASTGAQLFILFPSDGSEDDRFGTSIAIDNGIVIVGASLNNGNNENSGSVFIFNAYTGEQIDKIFASDGEEDDYFGISIAIDNGVVAVGETGRTFAIGEAYLFSDPVPLVREDLKLTASDGDTLDNFSRSIAIDDSIVAVGARRDDDNGTNSGSAYLFDACTGTQITKLLPNDGAPDDEFGYSIAINNGIVAAGAWRDDDNGTNSGSAYLFDASTSEQIAKLHPSDGAARDWFGRSISIANGIVAVGADGGDDSGSAYLFDASTGEQLSKLLPADGTAGDKFGWSIAIANGVVAVGAYLDDDNGTNSGSAYLFDASTGVLIAKLLPSDGSANDRFGYSVAIANSIVAVGAYLDDDNGFGSGSAYLFDASTGMQIAKLEPSDGVATDQFGWSIAMDRGVVAVGTIWNDDNGSQSGSAYLFDASTGAQLVKLLPSDGAADDNFGNSIAINNGVVAVGASLEDGNGENSGSAYVFDSGYVLDCLADLTGDGELNFFDVSGFLLLFQLNDLRADLTSDGEFNFFDVSAFLNAFSEGCP